MTVSQEKILQETSDKLQNVEKDLQSAQQQLITKDEQVGRDNAASHPHRLFKVKQRALNKAINNIYKKV